MSRHEAERHERIDRVVDRHSADIKITGPLIFNADVSDMTAKTAGSLMARALRFDEYDVVHACVSALHEANLHDEAGLLEEFEA